MLMWLEPLLSFSSQSLVCTLRKMFPMPLVSVMNVVLQRHPFCLYDVTISIGG